MFVFLFFLSSLNASEYELFSCSTKHRTLKASKVILQMCSTLGMIEVRTLRVIVPHLNSAEKHEI
jgi:hypothetical protein